MKRYLKLLMLILTASFFVLACQDTSDSSNGTNSGIEDGGNGNNNSGGGGTSLTSEIINATMRVSADEDDALKNTFFSPAVATNGGTLKYTWDFGDDTASVDTDYNYITHQFNKYGKTYTVKLLLNNMTSSQQETVTMDLKLPKPELSINCNTSGALIFCNPVISQQAVQDVSYTWNIFNSEGTLEKEILSAGPAIINHRVENSGVYKIVLTGTSAQVDGDMTAERNVYVSVNINQGQITYTNTSSDMLSYKYTFNAQAVDGSQLEYCWDFDGTSSCGQGAGYQLGAEYSIADHTYGKYNASHTVTAYARIPGTDEVVNNSIVVTQPLPEVSIQAEGTGLTRKLSPVFSFRPKGNLSYIWKTGDGKEYSQETVNHTYGKNGTYTAELTVLNDLFGPEIGSISAQPVNIYAYDNIQNVVIEYNRVSQSIEGETYTFSSPATSDTGKLYFTWKINNAVVAEGENLSSITHTFTKYGQNASVSLDVKVINSNEIVSAEPVLVQTSKPTAVLNPPANVTVDVPAEFKGEVLSHLNGEDFTANLINPQYMLEISDTEYKYSDTLTIPYTFITRGTYSAKLIVTADNVEGRIVSEPVTIQANEVIVVCNTKENPADIYSAIVTCKMESVPDKDLKYTLSYKPYIQSVYTSTEYAGEEVSEIILYNKDYETDLYRYSSRDIVVNWEIYRDKQNIEYMGSYQIKYTVKEPSMGKVVNIITNNISKPYKYVINTNTNEEISHYKDIVYYNKNIYALSENGSVYSWGEQAGGQKKEDYPVLIPKIVSSIQDDIIDMWVDNGWAVFKTSKGGYYFIQSSNVYYANNIPNEKFKVLYGGNLNGECYLLTESRELYKVMLNNPIAEKIEIGKLSKLYHDIWNGIYIITDDNRYYHADGWFERFGNIYKKSDNIKDFTIVDSSSHVSISVFTETMHNGTKDMNLEYLYTNANATMKSPNYSIDIDGKVYHYANYFPSLDDYQRNTYECDTGLGLGLGDEKYQNINQLSIPDKIVNIINDLNRTFAITENGSVYFWGSNVYMLGRSSCTPKLVNDFKINSPVKQQYSDFGFWYILLENGKLINGVDKSKGPHYINLPNNEKVVKMYGYNFYEKTNSSVGIEGKDGMLVLTENKNVYYIHRYEEISQISNLPKINDIVVPTTGSAIFITENNELYALGKNIDGVLGIGDIEETEKYTAVKIEGISNPVKYLHYGRYGIFAFTNDGKIYGWGANNGYLPIGHIFPQTTPVQLEVPTFKKIINGNFVNIGSNNYYNILTEGGDVYSWGYLQNTGTNAKENVSPNGYLMKPTKVN